ncbi:unnamed protein product [Caenorhabditis auriculariae]|uniref:Uncharacterized protein n=1 Tax=Caenorhabditis auriculariae TaxID=2777116 RepID=A0A8S1HFZ6_9PELO|nr:unnamed protein product [Caenorhabditis auriculariae]
MALLTRILFAACVGVAAYAVGLWYFSRKDKQKHKQIKLKIENVEKGIETPEKTAKIEERVNEEIKPLNEGETNKKEEKVPNRPPQETLPSLTSDPPTSSTSSSFDGASTIISASTATETSSRSALMAPDPFKIGFRHEPKKEATPEVLSLSSPANNIPDNRSPVALPSIQDVLRDGFSQKNPRASRSSSCETAKSVSLATAMEFRSKITSSSSSESTISPEGKSLYAVCYCREKERSVPLRDENCLFDPNLKHTLYPTDILPLSYSRPACVNLLDPTPEDNEELSAAVFERPEALDHVDDFVSPFEQILSGITYAHAHAALINNLLENYAFLDCSQ